MKILSYLHDKLIGQYAGMRKSVAIQQSTAVMIYCTLSMIVIGASLIAVNFVDFSHGLWKDPIYASSFLEAAGVFTALFLLRKNPERNWEWIEFVNYITITMIALWLRALQHADVPNITDICDFLMAFGMVVVATMLYILPAYSIPLLIILEMLYLQNIDMSPLADSPYIRTTSMAFTGLCIFLTIMKFKEGYRLYLSNVEQEHYAYYDQLTNLPNRRAFSEEVGRLAAHMPEDLCIVMVDLNGLKTANDSLGHEAGDELLVAAATCLTKAFVNAGTIYRIGGDEFAVILKADLEQANQSLETLEQEMNSWSGRYCKDLSIAYGLEYSLGHGHINSIIKEADRKMYENKKRYYAEKGNDRRAIPAE